MVFMNSVVKDLVREEVTKVKIVSFLNENKIGFQLTNCCGKQKICIDLNDKNKNCKRLCCYKDIIVQTSNKDICRIHPSEIIYITKENRKTVVYLVEKRIETNLSLEYWKDILNPQKFAQPHSSYIVNLNYVEEVTKDFVEMKCNGKEYSVYTSKRKVGDFKKAFLRCNK